MCIYIYRYRYTHLHSISDHHQIYLKLIKTLLIKVNIKSSVLITIIFKTLFQKTQIETIHIQTKEIHFRY